jgi:hypothetical protein
MCEQCVELDKKIERYRRLTAGITDPATIFQLKAAIEGFEAAKKALHPERQ